MKKLALLVHGIHSESKSKSTIRKLVPYLHEDGWDVQDFDYGWMASLQALLSCKRVAKQLRKELILKFYDEYDVVAVIGHSHGCEIIAHASDLMVNDELPLKRPKMKACLINPALESDRRLGKFFQEVDVWYTPDDCAVLVAQHIPFIPWGKMGRTGFIPEGNKTAPLLEFNEGQITSNHNIQELSEVAYVGHKGFFDQFILRKCIPSFLSCLNG